MAKLLDLNKNLKVHDNYLLIKRDAYAAKSQGGVLLTEASVAKKEDKKPIGKLIQKGPNAKCTVDIGKYVMYDPAQCNAIFMHEGDIHVIGTDTSILMVIIDPSKVSSL